MPLWRPSLPFLWQSLVGTGQVLHNVRWRDRIRRCACEGRQCQVSSLTCNEWTSRTLLHAVKWVRQNGKNNVTPILSSFSNPLSDGLGLPYFFAPSDHDADTLDFFSESLIFLAMKGNSQRAKLSIPSEREFKTVIKRLVSDCLYQHCKCK